MKAVWCLILSAAAFGAPLATEDEPAAALVSTVRKEKEWFCSISAPRASLDGIVRQLARGMDVEVEGLEHISKTALVTVELRDRPAVQALEWILGASNLRASWRTGVIQIRELVPATPTPDELREVALSTYTGALRSFPDPKAGAAAAFAKAAIYEKRGDIVQAVAGYDSLVRAFPQADQAAEALIRAARALYTQADYAGASTRYADVLRLTSTGGHELEARKGFADCLARQGEFRTALRLIVALDNSAPALTRLDLHQRMLIRARCVLGEDNPSAARALLRESENGGLEPELEADFYELTARSLPTDTPPAIAARAWLEHARRARGALREKAVAEAARLTRLSGDEIAALWIDRWAQMNGAGAAASTHAEAAREALGLDAKSLSSDPIEDRLSRAERLLRARLFAEGLSAFRSLADARPELDAQGVTRLHVGMAQCLNGVERVDDAIRVLREGLDRVADPALRNRFYLTAAGIFEARERHDDAILAYRGRL